MINRFITYWITSIMRYSTANLPTVPGFENDQCFCTSAGQLVDLTKLNVLHYGVDTLKQLYKGRVGSPLYELESMTQDNYQPVFQFFGIDWAFGRLRKDSGFKYFLKNQDLGVIILLVSAYTSKDSSGFYPESHHLKIEFSPHYLMSNDVESVQEFSDSIAAHFLVEHFYNGVDVHLACDIQGWAIPDDFHSRFVTRSRPNQDHRGVESFDIVSHMTVYGNHQSILYGQPGNVQFSLYVKNIEAVSTRKLQFWESVWLKKCDAAGDPVYRVSDDVVRFEVRFHHSVIKQLTLVQKMVDDAMVYSPVLCYRELIEHLASIWQYAFSKLFRLQFNSSKIDPVWSILLDPRKVNWSGCPSVLKRVYRKISEGSERNVSLALGNILTLFTRSKYSPTRCLKFLKSSGLWDSIFTYYFKRLYPDIYNIYKVNLLSSVGKAKEFCRLIAAQYPMQYSSAVSHIQSVVRDGITKRVLAGMTV